MLESYNNTFDFYFNFSSPNFASPACAFSTVFSRWSHFSSNMNVNVNHLSYFSIFFCSGLRLPLCYENNLHFINRCMRNTHTRFELIRKKTNDVKYMTDYPQEMSGIYQRKEGQKPAQQWKLTGEIRRMGKFVYDDDGRKRSAHGAQTFVLLVIIRRRFQPFETRTKIKLNIREFIFPKHQKLFGRSRCGRFGSFSAFSGNNFSSQHEASLQSFP